MKKSTKNLLLGAGLVTAGVAVAGTVFYGVTKKLVDVALARDGIKNYDQHKQAKKMLNGSNRTEEFTAALRSGEEYIKGLNMETWSLTSYDGLSLVAHWYPCDDAKRIIVAFHGWRSSWSHDFGTVAAFWHRQGCSVLFAEQRGQGESSGEYMGFGLTERFDCRDWVRLADERNTARLPIYLSGVSMGAATVLMASNLKLPPTVCGIIADCGFTSAHAIWKHVVNNKFKLTYGLRGKLADSMCRKKIRFGSEDVTAPLALSKTTIPVLFIHGTDDDFVPVTMTYENYQACASEKRLLVVPGADHAMSYFVDPKRYEDAVIAFWQDYDPKQPSL